MGRPRTVDVQTIVDAAARVFERRGYADATLDNIAAEAGISKPTIYQYVRGKQHLLEIIVEQVIYPLRFGLQEVAQGEDVTAQQKLEAYIRLQVRSATRYKVFYQVLLADQHQLSEVGLRNYLSWARQIDRATSSLLKEGIDAGIVRSDIDIPTMVNLLNSMLTSISRWYRPDGRLTPDQIVDEVTKLLEGVLAPATTVRP
jgi:AcrR family transcriptional regulator